MKHPTRLNSPRRLRALGARICIVALGLTAIGCNHALKLDRLDLDPSVQLAVGQLAGCRVTLVNNQPNTAKTVIAKMGGHRFESSLSQMTDAVVSQLSFELEKRRAVVTKGASKVLKIKVEEVVFDRGMWTLGTTGRVRVETGSNYVRTINIDTATAGTVDRLYQGVIQLAVTEILQDPRIASYLR